MKDTITKTKIPYTDYKTIVNKIIIKNVKIIGMNSLITNFRTLNLPVENGTQKYDENREENRLY